MPLFRQPDVAEAVVTQLKDSVAYFGVSPLGWVIMPSHVHLLIGFPQIERMSDFVQAFKSLSSRRVGTMLDPQTKKRLTQDGSFNLWMPRFDDVVIYTPEQFAIKLSYIHENPVKAGLCGTSTGWRYSSARDWLSHEAGPIPIDKSWSWM